MNLQCNLLSMNYIYALNRGMDMQVIRECKPYKIDMLGRQYNPGADPRFVKVLSQTRFNVYLAAAEGDTDLAFRLYRWNMLLAETFLMPCHLLEVGLRNGVSRKMWARFGAEWPLIAKHQHQWNAEPALSPQMKQFPHEAQSKVVEQREEIEADRLKRHITTPVTSDCVIAQMSFGFWTNMFSARYREMLWNGAAIRAVFLDCPAGTTSDIVYGKLGRVREIRNRVAHHEVIFNKQPELRYAELVELCSWLSRDLGHFIETTSHFDTVFAAKPQPNEAG